MSSGNLYDVFVLVGPECKPELACFAVDVREVARAIKNLDGNVLRFEVKPTTHDGRVPDADAETARKIRAVPVQRMAETKDS